VCVCVCVMHAGSTWRLWSACLVTVRFMAARILTRSVHGIDDDWMMMMMASVNACNDV
jgi:hypothetical protein